MRLTFLGTGAAEGYPSMFCNCANCAAVRRLGGRALRKRSAALVNDDLLLDLGPDLVVAAQQHGVNLSNIRHILQTHHHTDHLDPNHLTHRVSGFRLSSLPWVDWYGSTTVFEQAERVLRASHSQVRAGLPTGYLERIQVRLHPVAAGQTFDVGPYQVTALPATHGGPDDECLLHLIRDGQRTLFYGTDTGLLSEAAWAVLRTAGRPIHLAVLDLTFGPNRPDGNHLYHETFLATVQRLRADGLLAPDARVYATHISHDANPPHDGLATLLRPYEIEVAYDGLTIEF